MEQFGTFLELINHFSNKFNYGQSSWYKGYKNTHEQVLQNPISDKNLELIWYTRDNFVSSLKQGAPSQSEFQQAKLLFAEISQLITQSPDSKTYSIVQKKLQQAKKSGVLSKMYKALLNRAIAAIIPEYVTSTVDSHKFKVVANYLNKCFGFNVNLDGNWFENNIRFKEAVSKHLPEDFNPYFVNMAVWHTYSQLKKESNDDKSFSIGNPHEINELKGNNYKMDNIIPLNQILYGPPGTGKTYNTVIRSVDAAEPSFVPGGDSDDEIRTSYKAKYDQLVSAGRIRFVTFHQSYGYEEFVEGLSAKTEGDTLSYYEKAGIFKETCIEANEFIGEDSFTLKAQFDDKWEQFSYQLAESESGIKIETLSKKTFFTVTEVTNNTIRFDKNKGTSVHTLSVSTLKSLFCDEKTINGGLSPYYEALLEYLNSLDGHLGILKDRKNFVLVIDEINRGNISKIFGELITLIEPSKRLGQPEALEVTLPYSAEKFSVPDNLYIIGTMNTADRSLAMMDTALRRRFDFVEMMPKPQLFSGKSVYGIQLDQLLSKMNERIEVLYDREHTLGHAFFMPVANKIDLEGKQAAFTELQQVFKNKIIPLLEEYFFEDWNKIRLVLGDNRKQSEALKPYVFVREHTASYNEIFGEGHGLENYEDKKTTFSLADFNDKNLAWHQALAYRAIYDEAVLKFATTTATTTATTDEAPASGELSNMAEQSNA